jgi:subtilisin family serine protease
MSTPTPLKRKVHTLKSNQSDPFVRTVGMVLLIVFGLLLFLFLLRLSGCGRPEIVPDVGAHWHAPQSGGGVADWIAGKDDVDDAVWDELPNPDGGRRVRDRWRYPPPVVHPVPEDRVIPSPDEHGGRLVVAGYLNVYATIETNLRELALEISQEFPDDFVDVISYADEYKRVTIDVNESSKKKLRAALGRRFTNVEFVFDEAVFAASHKELMDTEQDWPWENVQIEGAWRTTRGNPKVTVAVIDGMFDPDHAELRGRSKNNWDVPGYDGNVQFSRQLLSVNPGTASHGTHVAALVAGDQSNAQGFGGFAPDCSLMLIQLSDDEAGFYTSRIVDALFYAKHHGAGVINLSLGSVFSKAEEVANLSEADQVSIAKTLATEEAESWNKLFNLFAEQGIAVVKAAGNESIVAHFDPMNRSESILLVGAVDSNGVTADFSNFGLGVDIYAPGVDIVSASANGGFMAMSGTSMAAPIAAGVVALLQSAYPNLEPDDLFKAIKESADQGAGSIPLLNAFSAMKLLVPAA